MLPAVSRMRSAADFTVTVRQGRRARRGALVVHHLAPPPSGAPASVAPSATSSEGPANAPLVGFVVGRSVGGSVVRHRVVRRLRAVTSTHLADLPRGSRTVVRALPEAAGCTSDQFDRDLVAALRRTAASPGARRTDPSGSAP